LPAVGGNGARSWQLEKDEGFAEDQAALELAYPRLYRVFAAVERQFRRLPTFNARPLAGETWLYRTREGFGAPALYVYYEIHDDEDVVRLLAADRTE
jgi:hypothetical protein